MSLEIRSYRPNDEIAILDLFRQVFSMERSQVDWNSKFLGNFKHTTLIQLAVDTSKKNEVLAGQYTLLPVDMNIKGKMIPGAQSLDTMTHPDYRGQGIFTKLASSLFEECKQKGFELLYGFPNDNSYPGFVKKLGWSHIGDIPSYVRILRSKYVVSRKSPGLATVLSLLGVFALLDWIYRLFRPVSLAKDEQASLRKLPSFDAAYEHFYKEFSASAPSIHVNRNQQYMNWRYFTFETQRNEAYGYYDRAGKMIGILVLSYNGNRAAINELMALDEGVADKMVRFAVQTARSRGASVLIAWALDHRPEARTIRKNGFIRKELFRFIVKDLAQKYPESLDIRNWYITSGDSDVF